MKIFIKSMVCDRCISAIRNTLDSLNLNPLSIILGEIDFGDTVINQDQIQQLKAQIEPLGFELINDKKSRLIENIKKNIVKLVQNQGLLEGVKLSDYLSQHLYHDYTHLSNLFSTVEGVTIEQYFINHKIEKTKELLVYNEMSLSEIADYLAYSSVAHLSGQFKKVTGMTPSYFKQLRNNNHRQSLDKV